VLRGVTPVYSLPRWRLTRWLAEAGAEATPDIRAALIGSLYGTLPIFAGGVVNTIAVSLLITLRNPSWPFILWFGFELVCCLARLWILIFSQRRAARGLSTPTDLYLVLGVAWAAGVGYGSFITVISGDWVSATLACLSAAAMVGGISFRNFGAPRLAAVMILLTLGPLCIAALMTDQPILLITLMQIPFYLFSMTMAGFKLNGMLISTMRAERQHAFNARHDMLTGLQNRSGLAEALDGRLARTARGTGRLALIYLDLDGFKAVNDTFGHMAGDRLLQLVADRLRTIIRTGDLVARIGGDEFIILTEQTGEAQLLGFGERLIRELSVPYALDNKHQVSVGASVGIALAPEHGRDMTSLLTVADVALYRAKSDGKSRCVIAAPDADRRIFGAAASDSRLPH
jgi:diguanylate cyclase (GGDEF)-like protein